MHAVISTFSSLDQAETAVSALGKAGFSSDKLGILLRGHLVQATAQASHTQSNLENSLSGGGVGALAGTAVGGLVGLLLGAASISVPVFGPIMAGGILATTLGGAASGAVYGTLLGVVLKLGLSEHEDVQNYVDTLSKDGVILVVEAYGKRAAEAWRIMHQAKATQTRTIVVGQSQNTSITMPVTGLFPNTTQAVEAMADILEEGIAEEKVHLLDSAKVENRLRAAESYLTGLGIDEADAPFYIDTVERGGALLIVTTDDNREAQISCRVMKKMDVSQMVASP